jgi:hypothetical protein
MMCLRWIVAALLGTALVAASCYSPNIQPGGFACGDGGACPDNFKCNLANRRCYETPPHDASADKPVCKSVTTAAQVCPAGPVSGQTCNPSCQTGCGSCGWCAIVSGATKCLTGTAGTKTVGQFCDPTLQSDCMPGFYCQPECGTGRCFQLCDSSDTSVCGSGSSCNVNPKTSGGGLLTSIARLCSLVESCDPTTQMGCTQPFACYPATVNECDCEGTLATGQPCTGAYQCVGGDGCVGPTGATTCVQTCKPTTACASGTTCNIQPGAALGYCL